MDLAELDGFGAKQEEGVFVTILAPDGRAAFRAKICGPDSRRARDVYLRIKDNQQKRFKRHTPDTALLLEADRIAAIAGRIMDWEGLTDGEGAVPYSKEHAVELLTKYRFICEQVDRASNSRSLFYGTEGAPSDAGLCMELSDMDRINQRQNDGISVPISGISGAPTGITMTIAGPDSDVQREARDRIWNRMIHQGGDFRTFADRERDEITILAASILDWEGVTRAGEPVEYSLDEAVSLLLRYPDVRDQVDYFSSTRALYANEAAKEASK